jgi:hypothetical protein
MTAIFLFLLENPNNTEEKYSFNEYEYLDHLIEIII